MPIWPSVSYPCSTMSLVTYRVGTGSRACTITSRWLLLPAHYMKRGRCTIEHLQVQSMTRYYYVRRFLQVANHVCVEQAFVYRCGNAGANQRCITYDLIRADRDCSSGRKGNDDRASNRALPDWYLGAEWPERVHYGYESDMMKNSMIRTTMHLLATGKTHECDEQNQRLASCSAMGRITVPRPLERSFGYISGPKPGQTGPERTATKSHPSASFDHGVCNRWAWTMSWHPKAGISPAQCDWDFERPS
jgi:hypothetical protein